MKTPIPTCSSITHHHHHHHHLPSSFVSSQPIFSLFSQKQNNLTMELSHMPSAVHEGEDEGQRFFLDDRCRCCCCSSSSSSSSCTFFFFYYTHASGEAEHSGHCKKYTHRDTSSDAQDAKSGLLVTTSHCTTFSSFLLPPLSPPFFLRAVSPSSEFQRLWLFLLVRIGCE